MTVAFKLQKFEHEIDALSVEEFARWVAYFRIVDKAEKDAMAKAKRGRGR